MHGKFKRWHWFAIFLSSVLIVGYLFWIFFDLRLQEERRVQRYQSISERIDAAKATDDFAEESRLSSLLARDMEPRVRSILELSSRMMAPIEFHGVVVDQNGQPVPDAEVISDYVGAGFFRGRGNRRTFTDSAGQFVLEGVGQEVYIVGVRHPDLAPLIRRVNVADGYRYIETYGFGARYFSKSDRVGASVNDPYPIRVWRVEQFESVSTYDGNRKIIADSNGSPVEKYGLRMSCTRLGKSGTPRFEWSISLEPVGSGGFQEATDSFLNKAPLQGYNIPSFVFGSASEDGGFRDSAEFDPSPVYYYRSENGGLYGVFQLIYVLPYPVHRECIALFGFLKFNPLGSTNLAVPSD